MFLYRSYQNNSEHEKETDNDDATLKGQTGK